MQKEELANKELVMIRDELLTLKKCQHNFLMFEIAGVGSLLGLAVPLLFQERIEFHYCFIALVGLIVIFPCLYLVLDKGISINRIASFFLVFERNIFIKNQMPPGLTGWENGNSEFRKRQYELRPIAKGPPGSGTQGPNKFYLLAFSISTILAIACYIIYFSLYKNYLTQRGVVWWTPDQIFIMMIVLAVIIGFIVHTSIHLRRLLNGIFTIEAMSDLWEKIIS
jgi:hypothetical protein